MTVKADKNAAVRRVFVPRSQMDNVQEALTQTLSKSIMGDPQQEGAHGSAGEQGAERRGARQIGPTQVRSSSVYTHPLDLVGQEAITDAFLGLASAP